MTSGVYVRLDRQRGGVAAYVGQAGDLIRRIGQHADNRQLNWSHALLLAHAATPYTEAEYSYLEGALHAALARAGYAMANVQEPGSDRLPEWDKEALSEAVTSFTYLLAGLGWRPTDGVEFDEGGSAHTPRLTPAGPASSNADPSPGDSFWWALAECLTVERSRPGSAGARRPVFAPDGAVVGQQVTGSLQLSINAVAEHFNWSDDLVRSEIVGLRLPSMYVLVPEEFCDWDEDVHHVARSLARMKSDHAIPFGREITYAAALRRRAASLSEVGAEAAAVLEATRLGDIKFFRQSGHITATNRFGSTRAVGFLGESRVASSANDLLDHATASVCIPGLGIALGWEPTLIGTVMSALGMSLDSDGYFERESLRCVRDTLEGLEWGSSSDPLLRRRPREAFGLSAGAGPVDSGNQRDESAFQLVRP